MTSSSEQTRHGDHTPVVARRSMLAASAGVALAAWMGPLQAQQRKLRVTLNSVANFTETTWAHLLEKGPRPAAYIFTTTYCSSCPEAFDKLLAFVLASHRPVELAVVVMDVHGDRKSVV